MIQQFTTLLATPRHKANNIREGFYKEFILVIFGIALSSLMLSSIAIYNRFPLLFHDSASYLITALNMHIDWSRPIFYGLFIGLLHCNSSLWPIVFIQSLIVSHIIYLTLRIIKEKVNVYLFLCLVFLLMIFTSLPWHVSSIMTEVFTGVLILCFFLLGFGFHRLSRIEIAYLTLLAAISISFHFSHILIALITIIAITIYRVATSWPERLKAKQLVVLICPLAASLTALTFVQIFVYHTVTISYYGSEMILARFIEDGIIKSYLHEHCSEEHFILCDHIDNMPPSADFFLWSDKSILSSEDGRRALRDEANSLVFKSLVAYPIWHLQLSFSHTIDQLISFSITNDLTMDVEMKKIFLSFFQIYLPGLLKDFKSSKEYMRQLPIQEAFHIHKIAILFSSFIIFPVVLTFIWQRQLLLTALIFVISVGIISNAVVCSTFALVYGRYQSRVIWLLVFYTLLGIWCVVERPPTSLHEPA